MRLRGRISFHFLIQFIVLFVATFLIIISLLLFLFNFIANEEFDINPHKAIVENIPISTVIYDEQHIELSKKWRNILKENHTWMQLINQDGEVIYSVNTPDSLQDSYSINDLLRIEETGKLDKYTVDTHFETWEPDSYYYLFGYTNKQQELLNKWYQNYSRQGMIKQSYMSELEMELEKNNGMIEVYKNGNLTQKVGPNIDTHDKKLDIIARIHNPGKQKTKTSVYNDIKTNTSWVFYVPNDEKGDSDKEFFLTKELQIIIFSLGISLSIAIAFSIWNGYRYGKPLLLFINWLEVVENKQYSAVLSEKERKKVYKKNGKIKFRYRLYKEVIQSFSNMTQKLVATEKEREQLEKTREEWMAGISHDLRTPLSSIQGYGHMLESNKYNFSEEELQEIGKVIRGKSEYMVDLVDDFSLVFKLKNSAITIHKSSIELNQFVNKVVAKYENDLTLRGYLFTFKSYHTPVHVKIDPKWFARVLDNLIYNAVKHNPPNTTVNVKIRKERDKAIIEIADNGIGMDEVFLNNMFDRYYRGTNTQERSEGEGLGMSIAKAIVDLHEGIIKVESEKDKGTTITIILQSH